MGHLNFDFISYRLANTEESDNQAQRTAMEQAVSAIIQQQLTPRQREVLLLYYFDRQTMAQIGKTLSINPSTVCRTLNRALRQIKMYLQYSVFHPN